jgi:molybdate transport system regulatory protein
VEDRKITRSQAAVELGVTVKTLYTWEKRGLIPAPERDARGWRWYTPAQMDVIRGFQRKLHPRRAESTRPSPTNASDDIEVSARNRLRGIVKSITSDGLLAEVVLDLGGGNEIVSVITRSSVERLGIRVGEPAYALMKATEVLLAR